MYIYKVTNIINGKSYIGKTTKSVDERWKLHLSDMKKKNDNNYFHNAIRKYGNENFEKSVIYECDDINILNLMETFKIMVNHTHKSEGGYNVTWGGEDNPMSHYDIIEKMRNGIIKAWSNPNNYRRFCNSMKGKQVKPFTTSHKENISKSMMGSNNPMYNKQWSDDSLKKRSKNMYRITHSNGKIENTNVLSIWCKQNNINYNSILEYIKKNKPYKGIIIEKLK